MFGVSVRHPLDDPTEDDIVLEGQGQKVVVDSVSLPFLADAVIDFTEELIGARFTIENPNATSSCGSARPFRKRRAAYVGFGCGIPAP
jgi:iron-sulfur cluster insertion protein